MGIARRMYLFGATLFVFLAASPPAEAQFLGEVVCWWCMETGDGRHHFTMNGRDCGSEGSYPGHPIPPQCVRCGKTSECHQAPWPGSCHIACGPEGDAVAALTEIQEALEAEEIAVVASALARKRLGVFVEFIPEGGRIDLLLPCEPNEPFHTIPVVPELRKALVEELQEPIADP